MLYGLNFLILRSFLPTSSSQNLQHNQPAGQNILTKDLSDKQE